MGTPLQSITWHQILANRAERRRAGLPVFEPELEKGQSNHPSFVNEAGEPEDPPLPEGYTFRSERETDFLSNEHSTGLEGLAWSVMLQAVQDGCNPRWLAEIAYYYQVKIDQRLVYRHPVAKTVVKGRSGRITRGDDTRAPVRRIRKLGQFAKSLAIPDYLVKVAVEQQSKVKPIDVKTKTNHLKK